MFFITRIDAFRAVADEKILVHRQTRPCLDQRYADLFGCTGIDGGLEHNHVALTDDRADQPAGAFQRLQQGYLVLVDGRRHRDNVEIAVPQRIRIGRIRQLLNLCQLLA